MNQTYIVKLGDTLYGISNQYGVSVNDLMNLNNVKPENLKVGQRILIPTKTGTNPDSTFKYIVKKGDSLYSIAKRYDTTVNDLVSLNNLKSTNLSINQELLIPEKYSEVTLPNYKNYQVKKGDTLYGIAKANNVNIDTLIKDNNLSNTNLSIGQNLKIRVEVVEECFGSDDTSEIIYTVKKGDSLYSIARSYNKTVNEIKSKNNLTSNLLSIGQKLKL